MPTLPCPTDDRLRAFDRGDVADPELDAVAAHLAQCEPCAARLAALAVRIGGFAADVVAGPDESAYRRAVERSAAFPAAVRPPLPVVGDTLRDYRLEEKIGQGGMGTVFRAVHTKLDKVVAVKVLSGKRWADPSAVVRFEREMKAVGRLAHSNIVQATDADDADGVPFLVMEFVDGENLSALVRRTGPRPLAEACGLIRQAAAGLHHAHLAGVVHRDVKPSNLMLTRDGTVKLLDLGLALSVAEPAPGEARADGSTSDGSGGSPDLTSASHAVGTVDYMAPEQRRDAHAVDARADVYGLGATLWFLLTGTPRRSGADPDVLKPPGGLPAEFWQRLLATDPADRFPTVAAAVDAMHRAAAPARWPWRSLGMVAVVILLVVVGGVAATTTSSCRRVARPTPPVPGRAARPGIGALPMTEEQAADLQRTWADDAGVPVRHPGPNGHDFALVPPGEFALSSQCRVRITRPFRLATTEVTVAQFRRFVAATEYVTSAVSTGRGSFLLVPNFKPLGGGRELVSNPGSNWEKPGHQVLDPEQPVCAVSWDDARAYCDWVRGDGPGVYRLPTEAELSWAVRCGDPSDEPIAPGSPLALSLGWHRWNCDQPRPVGTLAANAWGLFDAHGNVAEWCGDRAGPLPAGTFDDYSGPADPSHARRVFAGYSYLTPAFKPKALRDNALPDQSFAHVGFRVVCDLP